VQLHEDLAQGGRRFEKSDFTHKLLGVMVTVSRLGDVIIWFRGLCVVTQLTRFDWRICFLKIVRNTL